MNRLDFLKAAVSLPLSCVPIREAQPSAPSFADWPVRIYKMQNFVERPWLMVWRRGHEWPVYFYWEYRNEPKRELPPPGFREHTSEYGEFQGRWHYFYGNGAELNLIPANDLVVSRFPDYSLTEACLMSEYAR